MMLIIRINKPMTTLFSFIFIDLDIILQVFFSLKSLSIIYVHVYKLKKNNTDIHLMEQSLISSCLYISGNFTSVTPANSLIERWQARALHPLLDTEAVWDNVVTNR